MDSLKQFPIWLLWKKEPINVPAHEALKTQKFTKIPYQVNGQKASSVDPSHWTTYNVAESNKKNFSGIGFTISSKYPLLCIDLDHCINNEDGSITREDFEILVDTADTYTELSPSGDGLHIIFQLDKHFSLVANKKSYDDGTAFEVYTENRYFTYTGKSYGKVKPVRTISVEVAEELLRMVGYPWGRGPVVLPTVEVNSQVFTTPDEILLKKMFKAKGGAKLERLYNGDISAYNDDQSAGDAALLTSLAFWTAKNVEQMERIWLESPLGTREKTQKRKDYRDRTIANVLPLVTKTYSENSGGAIVKENAPIVPTLICEIQLDGDNNRKGQPNKNIPNVIKILQADSYLASSFRYNEFSCMVETNIDNNHDWIPYQTQHCLQVTKYIQSTYTHFENLYQATVDQAVIVYAAENPVNPPVQLIKSITWDNVPRIELWLTEVFGAEDTELNRAIASNWMKGLVNRVVTPGCQFDTVLVLEGLQGIGKSTALRVLAEPWYAETTMDVDTKDFQLILMQNIVVEFSEGASLSRSETSMMKQKITSREDNFRRPYDKQPHKYPRRCVFAMTTNEQQYLKDTTGNRRWLPVALPDEEANIDWLHENRLQMFAEAYHRVYNLKETTHEFPKEALKDTQSERLEEDPWVSAIMAWYFDELTDDERFEGVTTFEAYTTALWSVTKKDFSSGQARRAASIFKDFLFLERRKAMRNSVTTWRFFKTPLTDKVNQERLETLTSSERTAKAARESRKFYVSDEYRNSPTGNKF